MEKIKQAMERKILPTLKELREQGESDPEAALIFQALGAASTCWQDMTGTGIFDSDRAKRIGDELLYELRILSELEGSKLKELTDDAPFTAFESEHYKGSFGVRGPHYSVAGLVNMSAAEAIADKMNWAFRLGRDHGYLSPPAKEQGAEPVPAALISERSKPSLMVGFSEEEADGWRYKTPHGWVVTKTKTSSDSQPLFANTRAVSIDRIMEVVKETAWINDVDLLRERLMKITP